MDSTIATVCLGNHDESKVTPRSRKLSVRRVTSYLRPRRKRVSLMKRLSRSSENISKESGSGLLSSFTTCEAEKSCCEKLETNVVLLSFRHCIDCESYVAEKNSASFTVKLSSINMSSTTDFDCPIAEEPFKCKINLQKNDSFLHRSWSNLTSNCFKFRFSREGSLHPKKKRRSRNQTSNKWIGSRRQSYDKSATLQFVLKNKAQTGTFRRFLMKEFNEENLDFWLEVESYKKCHKKKQRKFSQQIYDEYVDILSPREINIDAFTRKITKEKMLSPDETTFDLAQERVFELMEKDPFQRYVANDCSDLKL